MLRIIFNGTIIISHDICWNISSIICSRKRQSVIGMLTSIKLNSTYSGYVKHLIKRLPNLELGKHIIGSSVFFYVNVDVFFYVNFVIFDLGSVDLKPVLHPRFELWL